MDSRSRRPLELAIIAAVITVLIGLASFSTHNATASAEEVRRHADLRAVEAADAAYAVAHGERAPDVQALVEDGYLREAPPHVRVHDGVVTLEP